MSPAEIDRVLETSVGVSTEHLPAVRRAAVERAISTGETILQEGQSSATLYIVGDGELAITVDADLELGRCGVGAIVGEVSFLDRGLASATVRATRPTTVLALAREAFDALYRDAPHAATAVMRRLCTTLAARIRRSSDLLDGQGAGAPPVERRRGLLDLLGSLLGKKEAV